MAFRVQLKRSWTDKLTKRKYGIGTVLQMTREGANEVILDGAGEMYFGEYPPKQKIKIDLKTIKQ